MELVRSWVAKPLGEVVTFQRGFDLPHRLRSSGTVPLVSSAGVTDFHASSKVQAPGVVTGRYGTIGEVFFLEDPFWPLNTTLFVRDFHGHVPRFVFYMLQGFDFEAFSGKTGVPGVNRNELHRETVTLPTSAAEQHAIATALSDVDALLSGLDRFITKKRNLKQAAMQQLLTGQTRLPGFTAKWVVRPLNQVGDIKSGGTPSTTQAHFWDGGVPWCTPTDITGLRGRKYLIDTERTISTAGLQSSSAEVIPPRSLIMTSRATIGECAINLVPVATNQGFKSIVAFAEIDSEFLYYLMTTQKPRLVALCAGSTFLEIGKKQLSGYMIELPRDRGEQEAIAAVLADMDAELAALEMCRDKTHDLRQAMMQQLLTGRTRLI